MRKNRLITVALSLAAAACLCLPAQAETPAADAANFPSRPVRIVVPYPAGGGSDAIARILARELSEMWKQPVIVDNRPGADTLIGTSEVVRAAPDGYTLLTNIALIVQNTFTREKMPYDTFKELRPLIAATETPMYFVASRQDDALPKSLADFIEQAKVKPGGKSFGSFGNGSTGHLLLLSLEKATSADITNVPFKGSGDVLTNLLSGQISSSFLPYSVLGPHLASGKVRILASTGEKRSPMSPDVPTFEESGIKGFTASQWNGYFISARTPPAIVKKLSKDMDTVIHNPEVVSKFKALGLSPVGGTPEQFQMMVDKDFELMRTVLKDGRLKLN